MIKKACAADSRVIAELAVQLFDGSTVPELEAEFAAMAESETDVCFLKYHDSLPVGFAQCSLRTDYVEGTETSPVGYLEGIYVKEAYRHRGFAKELLCACEKWAAEQGCSEFASDCELDNTGSLQFHLAMGFGEANRVICFTKKIPGRG